MKIFEKLMNFYNSDKKTVIIIIIGILFLIQMERIIYAINDNGYNEPSYLDVYVQNTPEVRIAN